MTAKPQVSPKTLVEGVWAAVPPSAGFAPNTVLGIPEPIFRAMWIRDLWATMAKTGKGYRHRSRRHTGRRGDKLGERDPKWLRRHRSNTVEK